MAGTMAVPTLLADDGETLIFLAESMSDAYTAGVVEGRLRMAVAALLPNVNFIRQVLGSSWLGGVRSDSH